MRGHKRRFSAAYIGIGLPPGQPPSLHRFRTSHPQQNPTIIVQSYGESAGLSSEISRAPVPVLPSHPPGDPMRQSLSAA